MGKSAAFARITAEVLALTRKIPAGCVTSYSAVGNALSIYPRHVAYILTTLDDSIRESVPWYRVVADGGAIGRHKRRDNQIRRLQAEGVAVSQGGFVQDFARFVILDIGGPMSAASAAPTALVSRSRGMKDRPR